jgi:uncharacterized repeat protein (TIGR04076 family)
MKREEYLAQWKKLGVVVTMAQKTGRCNHEVGETFVLKNPYDKPPQLCTALWHVISLYAWRVALGFPSWEADDESVYRLHCPSKNGTVWEVRKARPGEGPSADEAVR